MDLQTFVAETLSQIVAGVDDAKRFIAEKEIEAEVNPTRREAGRGAKVANPSPVEFDVAITVTDATDDNSAEKVGGKAGLISVLSLQASAELSSGSASGRSETNASRIKFSVMLAQPAHVTEYPKPRLQEGGSWKTA
ncbi:hypothetical protein K3152_13460 [Qipengyuania sp. 1NDH17]|uniref:HK97 gp10 family phage protein n=1 Tax=Qipengyuania polymorpha TaxID=2867234 RepID=A0ABS7J3W6_9SPHN|nr:hypothetical protein [Qipengyuania polymorpha]MBX7459255.1 hypothetical protein [Qipengyuania polymorpha]